MTKRLTYKELLNYYQLFQDFMDHIPDVIYFKDTKGRLILVNAAHAKGLGLKPKEVVGKTDFDIFPSQRAERMNKDDQYVLKTGKPIIDKIERGTRPDGVDNYVSTTKIPRFDKKGRVTGLVGVTRDVTKRMQLERLREERKQIEKKLQMLEDLNKLKSEFLSAVSHELRTPLAIIKQLLLLIYDETVGEINDKQREVLVKAKENIERLKRIIDQLLDISAIEGKRLKLNYSLVNFNELFKDSQDFFKEQAKKKNIRLKYDLPKKEINIFIDVERVIQVISNLIENALKYTEENGQIIVEVDMLETKVRVGVHDTGIGIPKAHLPKIFEKFVQVAEKDTPGAKGLGLGLAIAKEIVEKHSGEIWAESQAGVGSKFYFTLPRFFTADILEKSIKDKIRNLLNQGAPVYLINLLIVNFQEFTRRIGIGSQQLSRDLKSILDSGFKRFPKLKHNQIFISDIKHGKYSIIFPESSEKRVVTFCELIRNRTKNYFNKHKIEDVFIALGILSYPAMAKGVKEEFDRNLNIKEIYIGSEVRRFKRINYKTDIQISLPNEKGYVSSTIDLSLGGVCFLSQELLKTDAKIKMKLFLLKKNTLITALTRVAWIRKMDLLPGENFHRYKIGLEFIRMDRQDRKSLVQELKLYYE